MSNVVHLIVADGIAKVGIAPIFRTPNCVYLICIGYDTVSKKFIFKFGETQNVENRICNEHSLIYPLLRICFIISVGQNSAKPVEDTIKALDVVKDRMIQMSIDGKEKLETFACDAEDSNDVIDNVFMAVNRQYKSEIEATYYKGENRVTQKTQVIDNAVSDAVIPSSENTVACKTLDLQIEQEKTKQALAINDGKRLDIDHVKLLIQLAKIRAQPKCRLVRRVNLR